MGDRSSRSGTTYVNEAVLEYIDQLYHHESEAMAEAVQCLRKNMLPQIQVGKGDGALLSLLLRLIGARRVVEVGSLSGYSALWLVRGMADDGRLWTCENDPRAVEATRRTIERAGESHRIEVVEGEALDTLPGLEAHGPFDAVFIDADKQSYPAYGEWALDNLRPGGLVLADNAYLFGQLAGVEPTTNVRAAEIEAMQRFHRLLAERCDPATVIPIPDGLAVGVAR